MILCECSTQFYTAIFHVSTHNWLKNLNIIKRQRTQLFNLKFRGISLRNIILRNNNCVSRLMGRYDKNNLDTIASYYFINKK